MLVELLEIAFVFFKVGLFTIGGGLVAIPLVQQEVVERGLITASEFYNMVAVAESTPGPIGINVATYVGYSQFGILGALVSTISFIIPSFFIVSFLAGLLRKYRKSPLVINWFLYIKAAIVGLIGYSLVNVVIHVFFTEEHELILDIRPLILLIGLSVVYYYLKEKPWVVIIIGAVTGVLFL